jgi:SAM-dependent methyltransferase
MAPTSDPRQYSDAAERNAAPILSVLEQHLPRSARVLEIAAGTGQHAVHFARARPDVTWYPTDADSDALASIRAWRETADAPNLQPPQVLDVTAAPWPIDTADAIVCVNLVHIAPWPVTDALMSGAVRVLAPAGEILLYGPFRVGGAHTAASNQRFDETLQQRDPRWGIRDIDEVAATAQAHGLAHLETVQMPANNRMLVFRR